MDLFDYPPELNKTAWFKYLKHRRLCKFRKLKPHSEQGLIKWLIAQGDYEVQMKIVDYSYNNGYQGLFELKGTNNATDQTDRRSSSQRVRDRIREIGQQDIEENGFTPTLG